MPSYKSTIKNKVKGYSASLALIAIAITNGLLSCEPTKPTPAEYFSNRTASNRSKSPQSSQHSAQDNNQFKLVVLVVIDQFPSWSFTNDITALHGGLYQLVSQGQYFEQAVIQNSSTFTAPGHALIGTGANPSISGVLANSWFDKKMARVHPVARDENTRLFDSRSEITDIIGASSIDLKVEGLAETLRKHSPSSKSVSIGLKDRAVIHMIGQKPDLALWYNDDIVGFTTSTFYSKSLPEWVVDFNQKHDNRKRKNDVWKRKKSHYPGYPSDDQRGEGNFYGLGSTFPHDIAKASAPLKALRATPVGVDLTLDLATDALINEKLGNDEHADLLAITLSSHDYAGHAWGQESWERFEILAHIDVKIQGFINRLDRTVGKGNWSMVVTGDHGAAPLVEQSKKKGITARRIPIKNVLAKVEAAISGIVGPGDWIHGIWANSIYLKKEFHQLPNERKNKALDAVVKRLNEFTGIDHAGLTRDLAGNCQSRSKDDAITCRSLSIEDSGDIYFSIQDYSVPKGVL